MAQKLNISLEAHLRDALAALSQILPKEISQELSSHLSSETHTTVPLIPYDLVLKTSKWCQTTDGKTALQACSPPLDSQSYTMVSLLAGTRTSPEKRFLPYAAKDPEEDQRLRTKDRKAIATLLNAVLSVIGTGIATWWASERAGTRLEWRALSAVAAALIVAFAEIVLYMIWDSRQTSKACQPLPVVVRRQNTTANQSDPNISPRASSTAVGDTTLRHRIARPTTASPSPDVSKFEDSSSANSYQI